MEKIQIIAPKGARKNRKIIGRGVGSGYGSTSGKGTKGQKSRSGGGVRPGFEGGQMPLYRRIATRGFSNARFKKVYTIIKCGALEVFDDGSKVTKEELLRKRIIRKKSLPVKILSGGTLTKKLIVEIDKISKKAKETIISLGGKVTVKQKTKVKTRENEKDDKNNAGKKKIEKVMKKDKGEKKEKDKGKKKEKSMVKEKDKAEVKEKAGENGK